MTLDLSNAHGPASWMTDRNDRCRPVREATPKQGPEPLAAVALMSPREQAEAAWTPTSRYSVDELEALIRRHRRDIEA